MKVLFLDIDGVLRSERWNTPSGLRSTCVGRLCAIIRLTGCKIVVSSTWRCGGWEEIKNSLADAGFDIALKDSLHDFTPEINDGIRGDEIAAWLAEHPEVESFVILDDMADMGRLKSRLVRTDGNADEPLDDERMREALRLLADPEAAADNTRQPKAEQRPVTAVPKGKIRIERVENLDDGGMIVHYTGGISDVYEFREGPIPGAKPVEYGPGARLIGHVHRVERRLNGRRIT